MSVPDFRPGTTVKFTATITIDDITIDIQNDTVTFRMKTNLNDADGDAVLSKDADVASNGINGEAQFELTPTDTELSPGTYYYDLEWVRDTGAEYVLASDRLQVLTRVSDA